MPSVITPVNQGGRSVKLRTRLHEVHISWPPRFSGGSYAGDDRFRIGQMAGDAILKEVHYHPSQGPTSAQGLILITNQGKSAIAPADVDFLQNLYQKLSACIGQSLWDIGESDIDI